MPSRLAFAGNTARRNAEKPLMNLTVLLNASWLTVFNDLNHPSTHPTNKPATKKKAAEKHTGLLQLTAWVIIIGKEPFIHQFSSSMSDCNALLCKFSTTRWGTDDLTMPSLATKRKEIRHFFDGDLESHRSKEAYSLATPNTPSTSLCILPPRSTISQRAAKELRARSRCWTCSGRASEPKELRAGSQC
jgi:hypothetical protein